MVACSGNPISRWSNNDDLTGGMFVGSLYDRIDEAMALFGPIKEIAAHYSSERREGVITSNLADVLLMTERNCALHLTFARGYPKPGLRHPRTILCRHGYVVIDRSVIRVMTPQGTHRIEPNKDPRFVGDQTRTQYE